jgi:predicted nucleic acid-binding protein
MVERNDCATVLRATEIQQRHQLSFWDALIVAAAAQGGAEMLLSEVLNPGQVIAGVRTVNPFSMDDPDVRALLGNRVEEPGAAGYEKDKE